MRKKVVCTLLFVLLLINIAISVNAAEDRSLLPKSFKGRVGSSWGYVTSEDNVRQSGGNRSYVNWKKSSQSSAHDMWFRTVNSNGEDKGGKLFSYLENGSYETSAINNHYYYLQARRENSVDPETTVSGNWSP